MVRETEGLTFNSKSAEILSIAVERRWERSSNSGHQRCMWLFFFSRTANTIFSSRLFIQYKVSGYCHIESKKNISGNTKWTLVAPVLWSETISLCKKLNIIITCNPESYSLDEPKQRWIWSSSSSNSHWTENTSTRLEPKTRAADISMRELSLNSIFDGFSLCKRSWLGLLYKTCNTSMFLILKCFNDIIAYMLTSLRIKLVNRAWGSGLNDVGSSTVIFYLQHFNIMHKWASSDYTALYLVYYCHSDCVATVCIISSLFEKVWYTDQITECTKYNVYFPSVRDLNTIFILWKRFWNQILR